MLSFHGDQGTMGRSVFTGMKVHLHALKIHPQIPFLNVFLYESFTSESYE